MRKDNRINSSNILAEITFGEYLHFANDIIHNNDLQRRRVRTSKTVYSLLKKDLETGCIIPPLVLALSKKCKIKGRSSDQKGDSLLEFIESHKSDTIILDGLQRTYTLLDADREMASKSKEEYDKFLNNILRLEIYTDINKFGILYRMLTLNTGQTSMSFRHQLEMLYSDLRDTEVSGMKLKTDISGKTDPSMNEFNFSDAITGFNSYMERTELPIDRQDILDNLTSLENMADEDIHKDLFPVFLDSYFSIFSALRRISGQYAFTLEELKDIGIIDAPFAGNTAAMVFSTSQALSGYGSALGKMKEYGLLELSQVPALSKELENKYPSAEHEWLSDLLLNMDSIKNKSKRIGNSQRLYFHYFFRELLNKESDSYLDLSKAVKNGYYKYSSQI